MSDENLTAEESDRISRQSVELGKVLVAQVEGLTLDEHYNALVIIATFGVYMIARHYGSEAARDLAENLRTGLVDAPLRPPPEKNSVN